MGGSGVPSHLNGSVATVIRVGNDSTYLLQFENDDRWWASTSQLRPADIVALVVGKPSGEDGQYQAGDQVKVYPVNLVENPSMVSSREGWGVIQQAVDVVNHPPHYNRFPVEVINITEQLDFNRGNAVKYLARAGFKEGVDELEDLSKAAWYVNRAIEKLTKERESDDV